MHMQINFYISICSRYSVDALLVTCTPDVYTRERGGTRELGAGLGRRAKLPPMASLPEPCVPQPRAVSSERVFLCVVFFFLYSHVIYNPNSKAEKTNYKVDKFMQDTVTPPQHQLVLKRWASHSAACGQLFSQTLVLPDNQDVPCPLQMARPPRLARPSFLCSWI